MHARSRRTHFILLFSDTADSSDPETIQLISTIKHVLQLKLPPDSANSSLRSLGFESVVPAFISRLFQYPVLEPVTLLSETGSK